MVMLVIEPSVEERVIAERQAAGIDHHDEVWDGVYIVSPIADNEHQDLIFGFGLAFRLVIDATGLGQSYPGVNVSDQREDWRRNYRVPDVAVFLNGNPAEDRGSHWFGGPDFCVEIVSDGDRTRAKLDFYAKVGVRELLIVDRDPWGLELYRLNSGELALVGSSTVDDPKTLDSEVLPFRFRFLPEAGRAARPQLELTCRDGRQTWRV